MLEWQIKAVEENLDRLCPLTDYSSELIFKVKKWGIPISDREKDCLEAIPVAYDQSAKFYEMMIRKDNSFDPLITALEEACQTGASKLLKSAKRKWEELERRRLNDREEVAVNRIKVDETKSEKVKGEMRINCDNHDRIVKNVRSEVQSESNDKIKLLGKCDSTLKDFVEHKGFWQKLQIIPGPLRKEVLRQITEILSHLHTGQKPILHRDLHPENIFLKYINEETVVVKIEMGSRYIKYIEEIARGNACTSGTYWADDWVAPENSSITLANCFRERLEGDIYSLGCLFWYVLSNGEHPLVQLPSSKSEYQPKLEISSLENQNFHCNFIRLILFMIAFEKEDRPTIKDVRNHHVFWTAEKKLSFFTDSFFTQTESSKPVLIEMQEWFRENYRRLAGWNHSNFERVFSDEERFKNGWLDCLSDKVRESLCNQNIKRPKKFPYDGKSLLDLLKAIRNLHAHLDEKDVTVQNEVGRSAEDFLNYWHSRFPFLLDYVWTALQAFKNPSLKQFYEGIDFEFSNKIGVNETDFVV